MGSAAGESVVKALFGDTLLVKESVARSKTNSWKGNKLYANVMYADVKIVRPDFPLAIMPAIPTTQHSWKKDFDAEWENGLTGLKTGKLLLGEINAACKKQDGVMKGKDKPKKGKDDPEKINLKRMDAETSREGDIQSNGTDQMEDAIRVFMSMIKCSRAICFYHLENANWNVMEAYKSFQREGPPSTPEAIFIRVFLPEGGIVRCLSFLTDTVQEVYWKIGELLKQKGIEREFKLTYIDSEWTPVFNSVELKHFGVNFEAPLELSLVYR